MREELLARIETLEMALRAATEERATKEWRDIHGAIISCIDTHGPITREFAASAAKRIAGALYGQHLRRKQRESIRP